MTPAASSTPSSGGAAGAKPSKAPPAAAEGAPENNSSLKALFAEFRKVAAEIDTNFWNATPESRNTDRARLLSVYNRIQAIYTRLSPQEQSTPEVQKTLR